MVFCSTTFLSSVKEPLRYLCHRMVQMANYNGDPDVTPVQGTLAYMAPELLCGDAERLNNPWALDVYR